MYECSNVQPYVHPLGLMLQCGLDDSFRRQTGYNGPSQGPANGSQKACDYGAFKTPLYGVSPAYTGTQNTHKPLAGGSIPPVGTTHTRKPGVSLILRAFLCATTWIGA